MTRLAPQPQPTPAPLAPPLPRVDPIAQLPILILYPHSRCNCRCLMCDIWRATSEDEIAPEALAGWLDEWLGLGVRRVVLSGGEALMHRQLGALCAHLRGAGIGISILSTGLLLARHAALVAEHCDDLVVSLDGPPATHDEIRNLPAAFAKLAKGIAAVRAQSAICNLQPALAITARCTIQRANFRHMRAVVRTAHELGVDRISFLAADVDSDAFNRPGGWEAERAAQVALSADELPELAAELEALEREHAADFASGFIAEPPAKLRRRIWQHFAALNGQADFAPLQCNAPWVSSVIEADGTVRPCFFQPPLGNIYRDGGLAAVINAPHAIAWRQQLDIASDPICRRCVCSLNLREA
jgi:Fe-coproporphyrin III synthase